MRRFEVDIEHDDVMYTCIYSGRSFYEVMKKAYMDVFNPIDMRLLAIRCEDKTVWKLVNESDTYGALQWDVIGALKLSII